VSDSGSKPKDVAQAAREIAVAMDASGCEYAFGGAIALGYWGPPRGTLDIDVTLFLPPDQPLSCVRLLQKIGCSLQAEQAVRSLAEHGFCQTEYGGRRIDVFLPTLPFYEEARQRRQRVVLGDQPIQIWDAATLCVFKMMFFRLKDMADVQQLLQQQGAELDHAWVRQHLTEIYGDRDPRVSRWDELVEEIGQPG